MSDPVIFEGRIRFLFYSLGSHPDLAIKAYSAVLRKRVFLSDPVLLEGWIRFSLFFKIASGSGNQGVFCSAVDPNPGILVEFGFSARLVSGSGFNLKPLITRKAIFLR